VTVGLQHLRYFVAVADIGQISAAARSLYIAQPALSQSLRALERDVGVPLLRRHARGVTTTPAGERFLQRARVAVRAADDAVQTAREATGGVARLTVGAASGSLLGELLAGFRAAFPDVDLTWRELSFLNEMRAVRDGEVDVSFVVVPYREPTLTIEPLRRVPAAVYCGWDHRLARERAARFDQVAEEVMPAQRHGVPDEFADHFYLTARRGHRPRTSASAPETVEEVFSLIASGEAVCVGPSGIGSVRGPAPAAVVPLSDVEPFELGVASRTGDASPTLALFLEHARGVRV
jgi:DNA-binding transcriptional LysR family regulator